MFTGIIEGLGTIKQIHPSGRGKIIIIESDFPLDQVKLGDSIAVSGACLTVVRIEGRYFTIDMSPETFDITTFRMVKAGSRVNIERALRLSDRLDGHLVSGHVDGTGILKEQKRLDNVILVTIQVPSLLSRYMIPKGSVAVDGISLTINKCFEDNFEICIIPHTAMLTTIDLKKAGDSVNIETDMIGKYVERFMTKSSRTDSDAEKSKLDMDFLNKAGFL